MRSFSLLTMVTLPCPNQFRVVWPEDSCLPLSSALSSPLSSSSDVDPEYELELEGREVEPDPDEGKEAAPDEGGKEELADGSDEPEEGIEEEPDDGRGEDPDNNGDEPNEPADALLPVPVDGDDTAAPEPPCEEPVDDPELTCFHRCRRAADGEIAVVETRAHSKSSAARYVYADRVIAAVWAVTEARTVGAPAASPVPRRRHRQS